jgi:hypothetical protein
MTPREIFRPADPEPTPAIRYHHITEEIVAGAENPSTRSRPVYKRGAKEVIRRLME